MRQWERESIRLMGGSAAALRLLGLWPDGGRRDGGRRVGDAPVGALLLVANDVSLGLMGLSYVLMVQARDLKSLSEAFFDVATSISLTNRILILMRQKVLVEELVTLLMEARKRFPESVPGIRARYQTLATTMFWIWQILPLFPLMLWVLEPVLVARFATHEANATADSLRTTPLPIWLPGDVRRSPTYEITYVLQAVGLVLAIGLNGFFDIIYVVFMVHIAAELDVLNQNMSTMKTEGNNNAGDRGRYDTRLKLETHYESAVVIAKSQARSLPFPSDLDVEDRMYLILVENIKHHQLIMAYIRKLEEFMRTSIFFILLTNALSICLQVLGLAVMLQEGVDLPSVLKMMLTFPAYSCETGLFCMFGQTIIDQSDRLVNSAFSCDWMNMGSRFRRSLTIFMLQASQPLQVKVGKQVVLSRHTFLRLLNGSYSLFNMLHGVQK